MFPLHIGLYKSSLNLYYKQYLYAVNGEKSYQIISANMNQSVTKQIGLEAGYLFLPRYLIRYYQDPTASSTHFIGCTFAEHLFTIGLNYKLQNIQFKPYGRYEIDQYKENFDFYNSHAIRYGMDLNWSISRSAYLNLGIDRKQNSAKGPLPDISYDDNAVSAQIQTRVLNLEKLYLNLGADYAKRFYTTKNSATIDPFHRDRVDTKLSFSGGLEYRFSKNLRLNLEYNREIRRVSSPYQSNIDDIKDYNNNKLTLGLRFNLSKLTEGD
jgi:opacity protein-like surface antigen